MSDLKELKNLLAFAESAPRGQAFDSSIEESFQKQRLPNLEDSGEFITNSRGLRLHCHTTR
tara:strand:- start:869 stop:1051 length:183 start_codon:yes stop_codon:yes gene_type:complete